MRVSRIRIRDFRNIARFDATIPPGAHLIMGANAQGKSAFLEAVYLMATLRSFRGASGSQMVQHGAKGYFVGGEISAASTREIKIFWSSRERRVQLDDQPIRRLADLYEFARMVVFSNEDLQLTSGAPRVRRRFIDLILAQSEIDYLPTLQGYARAIRSRNALLRNESSDIRTLDGFTKEAIKHGEAMMRQRAGLIPQLEKHARSAYARIAPDKETLSIEYQPNVKSDFTRELAQSHPRERALGSTVIGPHRDDLRLRLDDRPVANFASEGQKRSVAIALRMAQTELLTERFGQTPILLIDDVLGELDASRRAGFLPLLERPETKRSQAFITCTETSWPKEISADWGRWRVCEGVIEEA